jgi:hypothetical protein
MSSFSFFIYREDTLMKQTALLISLGLLILCVVLPVSAAEPAKQNIVGDWKMKSTETDGPPMDAMMTISKDKDGKLAGKWLAFFGPADLKDVKFEGDKLTFTQTARVRGQEMTLNFSGTLKEGKIAGKMSNNTGEFDMEGTLMQPKCAVAGKWEITTKRQDRETTSTLMIKADKEGKLSGTWQSQRGGSEIPKMAFNDGKLTFKRKITRQDQEMEISYELAVKSNTISGIAKTQQGESSVTGKRIDSPAVGTWELTMTSERGERKQLLTVYADMTALYGPSELDTFAIEDNKVAFKMTRTFGDRTIEIEFKGTLEGDKLTGQMTSGPDRPAQTVTGKKLGAEVKIEAKPEPKK